MSEQHPQDRSARRPDGVPLGPYFSGAPAPALPPTVTPQQPQPGWAGPAPQPQIARYAAPRVTRRAWLIAAVVAVGLLVAAIVVVNRPGPFAPTPATPTASQTPDTPGQPFSMPSDQSSGGTWEVVEREWDADGVHVRVRVYATRGRISYGFLAFPRSGADAVDPVDGGRTPALTTGVLTAGDQVDGWIFIPTQRGDVTLFLTTSFGRQISALPVAG